MNEKGDGGGVAVFHSLASSKQGQIMVHLMKSDVTHHIVTVGDVGHRKTYVSPCIPSSVSICQML